MFLWTWGEGEGGSRTFGLGHWEAPCMEIGKPGEEALTLLFW